MGSEIIARKYAKAFLQITGNSLSNRARYKESFNVIKELFATDEISSLLYSYVMPQDLKKSLFEYAFDKGNAPKELRDFILTLVEAKRVHILPELLYLYDDMLCEVNGLVIASVTSSCVLSSQELSEIKAQMESLLKKEVSLKTRVDKSLLGGVCIQYGHTLIDLSLRHKLDLLTAQVAL